MLCKVALYVLCAFTTSLFSRCATADPFTIVYTSPAQDAVQEILNLQIDGLGYDVTFGAFHAVDSTFFGNVSGATDAVNAIVAALNTSTAAFVNEPGSGVVDHFAVLTDASHAILGESAGVGSWFRLGSPSLDSGSTAQFQIAAVPEPTSAILLISTVAGILLVSRRKRFTPASRA
jgi:hypothetical protein